MLSLRNSLTLDSISSGSSWQPSDEGCLEAWYKKGVGITTVFRSPHDYTTSWTDSSSNTNDMVNSDAIPSPPTAPTQPIYYGAPNHQMEFNTAWLTFLKSASSISLSGEFTIVIRMNPPASPNGKFLSSDSLNSYFEYASTSQIKFKLASGDTPQDLDLNGATTFGDDYLIITRNDSDLVTLWRNGVEQTASVTSTSALTLNGLGYNSGETLTGSILEVQMYSCSNATLTSNANTYASTL